MGKTFLVQRYVYNSLDPNIGRTICASLPSEDLNHNLETIFLIVRIALEEESKRSGRAI